MPFEVVEHTADVGIKLTARDAETFFGDAALGMFHIIFDGGSVEGWPETHDVSIESADVESLLVDWLSELLYLFEVKKFIFGSVEFSELSDTHMSCRVSGTKFRGEITGTEIKAVTYHLLDVKRSDSSYEATVYFDL